MAQKLHTELSLIEWCDQQVKEGKELSMGWEGGGDSGWCYFQIDGKQIPESKENEHIQVLLNAMYDQLDYGSWAGEFSASGTAVYNPTEKAFVGTDYYSEDDTESYPCNIQVRVPKKLWFDRMEIAMEGDDSNGSDAAFTMRNGFLTEEHNEFITNFLQEFDKKVEEVVDQFCKEPVGGEYKSIWQNWDLQRSEFTEEGDDLVYEIDMLDIAICNTNEKDIYLQLEHVNTEDYD
jgi:hypothetical protein